MSDPYPIIEVKPKWVLEPEAMGSKDKFWFKRPDEDVAWLFEHPQPDTGQHWAEKIAAEVAKSQGTLPEEQGTNWLFKYPRQDTGEHWAEKIAAEVAKLLGVPHAKVELAAFSGERGSVTESFVRVGQELVHGNQLLEGVVHSYDPAKEFHQSSHTLANIWQVMDRVFEEPAAARRAKLRIAACLVLDALIGNTDRHHENWGILRKRVGKSWLGLVAPSFDHASSLGRELLDESRDRRLAEDRVGDYAEKGRGAIYWSDDGRRGPSPLKLVRLATRHSPDIFRPALTKLERLDKSSISDCVNGVPSDWMTPLTREFAIALMCYNRERLQELLQ